MPLNLMESRQVGESVLLAQVIRLRPWQPKRLTGWIISDTLSAEEVYHAGRKHIPKPNGDVRDRIGKAIETRLMLAPHESCWCMLMKDLEKILSSYGRLLAEVDAWFARCLAAQPQAIVCGAGCSECCRGLFDITLLDACYLKYGFDRLDAGVRAAVRAKAIARLQELQLLWPDFREPYILNYRPEEEWEVLMPEDDETPCPLVDNDGRCILYNFRPMTCRLNGIPLVDLSGEVFFEEWCTLNFTGSDPLAMKELRGEFRRIFAEELLLFQQLTASLCKQQLNELDTFIPTALLIDFAGFDWPTWLRRTRLVENPLL